MEISIPIPNIANVPPKILIAWSLIIFPIVLCILINIKHLFKAFVSMFKATPEIFSYVFRRKVFLMYALLVNLVFVGILMMFDVKTVDCIMCSCLLLLVSALIKETAP